jgi:acyl-CoA thioester hydrolase
MIKACECPISPSAIYTAGPVRVLYSDTDRMGYAYYSRYLVWFEIGRTTLLRQLGGNYREWEDLQGISLPVRSCHVQYLNPATYDEAIVIETSITRLTRASITIHYRVRRETDELLLAEGNTTHAFVNQAGQICRVADRLLPQFFQVRQSETSPLQG